MASTLSIAEGPGRAMRLAALGAALAGALTLGAACQTVQDVGDGLASLNPLDHSPDIDKPIFAQIQEAMHSGDGAMAGGAAQPGRAAGEPFTPTALREISTGAAFADAPALLIPDGAGLDRAYADRMGVVDLPKAEDLLNTMLGRIQAAAPGAPVPARVYIEPNRQFMARAEKDGAIFISLGALRAAESDADLLFLLAHEYAHIALGHFQDAEGQEAIRTTANLAGQFLLLRTAVDDGEDAGDLNRALRYPRGVSMLTDALFWRGWNQHDEMEADLFAADVMAAFGVHPLSANEPIGRIAQSENEPLTLPIFDQSALKLGFAALLKGEGGGAEKRELINLAASSAFALAERGLREITGDTHPDAETRQTLIGEYVEAHYLDAEGLGDPGDSLLTALNGLSEAPQWVSVIDNIDSALTAVESSQLPEQDRAARAEQFMYDAARGPAEFDPYTRLQFANVRAFTGEPDKAVQNLELALRGERTPFKVFLELAARRIEVKDYPGATRAIEQGLARYPAKANDALPMRIRLEGVQKNTAGAHTHLQTCRNTSLQSLIANCEIAWQKHVLKPATS